MCFFFFFFFFNFCFRYSFYRQGATTFASPLRPPFVVSSFTPTTTTTTGIVGGRTLGLLLRANRKNKRKRKKKPHKYFVFLPREPNYIRCVCNHVVKKTKMNRRLTCVQNCAGLPSIRPKRVRASNKKTKLGDREKCLSTWPVRLA